MPKNQGFSFLGFKNKYFPNFTFKHALGLAFISLMSVTILITARITQQNQDTRSGAEEGEEFVEELPEFPTNQVLVKISANGKGNLRADPNGTGIPGLDKVFRDYDVVKFEQIAKDNKSNKKDHEVFRWYLVETSDHAELMTAKFNKILKKLETPPPSGNARRTIATANAQEKITGLIDRLSEIEDVEDVEPNYILHAIVEPNDPYFPVTSDPKTHLWGMHAINAPQAWDSNTGSADVVVGVIDTGMWREHEDLAGNVWTNPGETPDNGVDDDNNGYVDDYQGWDFVSNDNNPQDGHGHGTHVSGTISGFGNNGTGVVGVNWNAKIIPLKGLADNGSGYTNDLGEALTYAVDMGASVTSNSWGGSGSSTYMDDIAKYHTDNGVVMVVAAGNSNRDTLYHQPANSDHAISVGAIDINLNRASFSNFGQKVDVSAPGVYILSTHSSTGSMCGGATYCAVSGTSMATPHVSGLVALLVAQDKADGTIDNSPEEIRQILRSYSDQIAVDKYLGKGLINAFNSNNNVNTQVLAPFITSPKSRTNLTSLTLDVFGTIENFDSSTDTYKVSIGTGKDPSDWSNFDQYVTYPGDQDKLANIDPTNFDEGLYSIRLEATRADKTYEHRVFDIIIDNFDVSLPLTPLVSKSSIDIFGTASSKNALPNFNSYTLEYSLAGANDWNLITSGNQPVVSGLLGAWDTTGLTNDSWYDVRLTVNASSADGSVSKSTSTTSKTKVDTELVAGWPKVLDVGYYPQSAIMMGDVNGDGNKDVVYPDAKGVIHAWNKDGSYLPNFPVDATLGINAYYRYYGKVADLDGDGDGEILLVAIGDNSLRPLVVVNGLGEVSSWNPSNSSEDIDYRQSPTVGDIDLDGKNEIVVLSRNTQTIYYDNYYLYALNYDESKSVQNRLSVRSDLGYPSNSSRIIDSNFNTLFNPGIITLSDLNSDQYPELIFNIGNGVYVHDKNGQQIAYFKDTSLNNSSFLNGYYFSYEGAVTINDSDQDGTKEIYTISSSNCKELSCSGNVCSYVCYVGGNGYDTRMLGLEPIIDNQNKITGLKARVGWPKDGSVNGFQNYSYKSNSSPVVVDRVMYTPTNPITKVINDTLYPYNSSINTKRYLPISDIDGDGVLELNFSGDYSIGFYDQANASRKWYKDLITPSSIRFNTINHPTISDMDTNGKMEIAEVFFPLDSSDPDYRTEYTSVQLYLWEINNSSNNAKYEWPIFGRTPDHSNILNTSNPDPSPTQPPSPTPTPVPSPVPSPTPSPTPTPTPNPSPTANPSPTSPPISSCGYCQKGVCDGVCRGSDNRSLCPDCTGATPPPEPSPSGVNQADCSNYCFKGVCDGACHPSKDNQTLCPDCPGYIGGSTATAVSEVTFTQRVVQFFQPVVDFFSGLFN